VEGHLGELQFYDSQRIGPRPPEVDVDVLWDLAAHDIAILDYVFERVPEGVSAIGLGHPAGSPVDDVHITFTFGSGFISHIHVNWLSPVKIRRTLIGGSRRMISYDDLEPIEKLRVSDHDDGLERSKPGGSRIEVDFRPGKTWIPKLDTRETLAVVAAEFLDCIVSGRQPRANGASGLRVVRVLEVASVSLKRGGAIVRFPDALTI
jgi:predicted dehydrogenase